MAIALLSSSACVTFAPLSTAIAEAELSWPFKAPTISSRIVFSPSSPLWKQQVAPKTAHLKYATFLAGGSMVLISISSRLGFSLRPIDAAPIA